MRTMQEGRRHEPQEQISPIPQQPDTARPCAGGARGDTLAIVALRAIAARAHWLGCWRERAEQTDIGHRRANTVTGNATTTLTISIAHVRGGGSVQQGLSAAALAWPSLVSPERQMNSIRYMALHFYPSPALRFGGANFSGSPPALRGLRPTAYAMAPVGLDPPLRGSPTNPKPTEPKPSNSGNSNPNLGAASGPTRRPSAGYALPYGHPYRGGGYRRTLPMAGLRAPAHRERQSKPLALSGPGDCLDNGFASVSKKRLAG